MSDDEFNELTNGPLYHPMVMFRVTRLILALRAVVDACGEQGDNALREACAAFLEQDDRNW